MNREELEQEFIKLRNAQITKGYTTRDRNNYFDWLNDSDMFAKRKTDEELIKAIERMKRS